MRKKQFDCCSMQRTTCIMYLDVYLHCNLVISRVDKTRKYLPVLIDWLNIFFFLFSFFRNVGKQSCNEMNNKNGNAW